MNNHTKFSIGVDISGGDFAPAQIFKGAVAAKYELSQDIVLIGSREEIVHQAKEEKVDLANFEIIDAPEKIAMGDQAAMSVRRKRNSSIVIGSKLLRDKKIDAFVSCGNTGAVTSAATLMVQLIEGAERPGIAVMVPTIKGASLLIDAGANINPKPLHLLQYGIMASLYYDVVVGKKNPTIGLLNIGEEASKGSGLMKIVHKLFVSSPLNFVGNVEAGEIFSGCCDCVICDGLAGNIVLKVSEGLAELVGKFMTKAVKKDLLAKLGILFMSRSLKKIKRKIDYAEYGGAPLLGVNGVVIIGHGRSSAYAVKNAIRVAVKELNRGLIDTIKGRLYEICQDSRVREILAA